jgi:DNA-binding beta-propeller fold protein YncE
MIATTATAPFILAKFGHDPAGPIGRRLVVAPDGSTAYAAGADGIVAIDLQTLSVVRHDLGGSRVVALGLTPDGSTLFALVADGGRIVALDATTGRSLGSVEGAGYDRLLAVGPW